MAPTCSFGQEIVIIYLIKIKITTNFSNFTIFLVVCKVSEDEQKKLQQLGFFLLFSWGGGVGVGLK